MDLSRYFMCLTCTHKSEVLSPRIEEPSLLAGRVIANSVNGQCMLTERESWYCSVEADKWKRQMTD